MTNTQQDDELIDRMRRAYYSASIDCDPQRAVLAVVREYDGTRELYEALKFAERHCPCGARPESPETHPHVPGCVVAAAINRAEGKA